MGYEPILEDGRIASDGLDNKDALESYQKRLKTLEMIKYGSALMGGLGGLWVATSRTKSIGWKVGGFVIGSLVIGIVAQVVIAPKQLKVSQQLMRYTKNM